MKRNLSENVLERNEKKEIRVHKTGLGFYRIFFFFLEYSFTSSIGINFN